MSHKEFENIGDIKTRTIEECSELIKELCKVERFGWFNYNPFDPNRKLNIDKVLEEIGDVELRLKELKEVIFDINRNYRKYS